MTPAKLMALQRARGERFELLAHPVDKLAWIYKNANRDPGSTDEHGNQTRPPADVIPLDVFKTLYVRRPKSLAAKDQYDHVLLGAKADISSWISWVKGKGK